MFILLLRLLTKNANGANKRKRFHTKKIRSWWYPAEAMMDTDYADDQAVLANTSAQAESFLHSLEKAAGGIGLLVNVNKTELMYFKQEEAISTLRGMPLKFTYLGSNISSCESDVNIRLVKEWNASDRSLIIWKSDLSDKIKREFFQAVAVSMLLYGCTTCILTKIIEKRLRGNYTKIISSKL